MSRWWWVRHENEHKIQVERKGKRIGLMVNVLTIKEFFNKLFKRRKND